MPKTVKRGGNTCCIPNCFSRTVSNDGVSFHKFPSNVIIRDEWIRRIRFVLCKIARRLKPRPGVNSEVLPEKWLPLKSHLVCGLHFQKTGIKSPDDKFPMYIENYVFSNDFTQQWATDSLSDIGANVTISNFLLQNPSLPVSLEHPKEEDIHYKTDHSYCVPKDKQDEHAGQVSLKSTINLLTEEISTLQKENAGLVEQIGLMKIEIEKLDSRCFSFKNVSKCPKQLRFYTGFHTIEEFINLYGFLEEDFPTLNYYNSAKMYSRKSSRKESAKGRPLTLDYTNQLFLVLCRMRVGLLEEDLSCRFNISEQTVSNIWITIVDLLYRRFTQIPIWPSHKTIDEFIIPENLKTDYPRTNVTIDSTELLIETTSEYSAQSETYCQFGNHNTVKRVVGISPNGHVTYVSDLSPDRISGKKLKCNINLSDLQTSSDTVLVDHGFPSREGIEKTIPTFFNEQSQLVKSEIEETKEAANPRMPVDRIVREMKTWRILKHAFPSSMHCQMNKVWKICCFLTNFKASTLFDR